MKSLSNKTKGDNSKTKKARVGLSFLYVTCRLVLFYIIAKYEKIFQRVFDLQSRLEING